MDYELFRHHKAQQHNVLIITAHRDTHMQKTNSWLNGKQQLSLHCPGLRLKCHWCGSVGEQISVSECVHVNAKE